MGMRSGLVALAMPFLVTPLAAQRAARGDTDSVVPAMQQVVTVDLADAVRDRYSARIEPLVFGRFSLGLSGELTTTRDANPYAYPYPVGCAPQDLCTSPVAYQAAPGARFREWSFGAHGRWSPAALARANARQSIAFYMGEFVGYRERRTSQTYVNPCPYCAQPAGPALPDTTGGSYYPYPGGTTTNTYTFSAWEPGAEFGVRIGAARHLVIDVGSSFRLVRLDDYLSSQRRGDVDSRLTLSIGFGW